MSLNRKPLERDQVSTPVVIKTADYTMKPYESVVGVDTTGGAVTITLPYVAEANGKTYSVIDVGNYAGTNNITVQDNNESRAWADKTVAKNSGSITVMGVYDKYEILASDLT
jgi:hypothetical protein